MRERFARKVPALAANSEPLFAAIAQSQGATEPPGYARIFFVPVYAFLAWVVWRDRRQALSAAWRTPLLLSLLAIAFASTLWSIDSGGTLRRSIWLMASMLFGLYLAWRNDWRQLIETLAGAYIVLIVTTWLVAGRFGPPRDVLLLRSVPLGRTVGIVLGTTVLVAVASAAVLEPLFHGAKAQDVDPAPWPGGLAATVGVALTVLVFVVLGPVAEELYFRGLVMPALGGLDAGLLRATVGIGGSALVFAVVHWTPAAIPVLALLGAALALVARRTGSIWPGVAIHALNNALATALAFGHAWT